MRNRFLSCFDWGLVHGCGTFMDQFLSESLRQRLNHWRRRLQSFLTWNQERRWVTLLIFFVLLRGIRLLRLLWWILRFFLRFHGLLFWKHRLFLDFFRLIFWWKDRLLLDLIWSLFRFPLRFQVDVFWLRIRLSGLSFFFLRSLLALSSTRIIHTSQRIGRWRNS
jgi:hypothetical protein